MTFILAIVQPDFGAWLSVDNRISRGRTTIDDNMPKQVFVKATDGTMTLAFAGLAEVGATTPMIDWVRRTISSETRTVEEHFRHLVQAANADISGTRFGRHELHVVAVVMQSAQPPERPEPQFYLLATSNMRSTGSGGLRLDGSFEYEAIRIDRPMYFAIGSGRAGISQLNLQLLDRTSRRRPARPSDYVKVLKSINRDVAKRVPSVSPWSDCRFMSLVGVGWLDSTRELGDLPAPDSRAVPFILDNIDLTDMTRIFKKHFYPALRDEVTGIDDDAFQAEMLAAYPPPDEPTAI